MEPKALRILEFDKITGRLAQGAVCAGTRDRCLELTPGDDIYEVTRLIAQTTEAENLIIKKGAPPISPIKNAKAAAMRAAAGGVLTMSDLLWTGSLNRASSALSSARRR